MPIKSDYLVFLLNTARLINLCNKKERKKSERKTEKRAWTSQLLMHNLDHKIFPLQSLQGHGHLYQIPHISTFDNGWELGVCL
jgi:hypothetical protein